VGEFKEGHFKGGRTLLGRLWGFMKSKWK